jgi:hypothetical protein
MTIHRLQITWATVCAVVALSGSAFAQRPSDVECKKTETQAECHARLKCKADEELDDCKKRLLQCKANEDLAVCKKRVGDEPPKQGERRDRDNSDAERGERRDRDNSDAERGERRQRDNSDAERGDRRQRDDGGRSRRQRGEGRDGDRRHGGGGGGFEANKKFALGLELGEPSGLNGKVFVSRSGAVDFGVGWIYSPYYYGDGFHIYADYLWHPTSLASTSAFELPFYIGGGLRFWDFNYCDQQVCNFGGTAIGLRIPVGISFDFNRVPLDIFVQLVPVIDFVNGDYYDRFRDRAHLGIDLSLGLRYWFK